MKERERGDEGECEQKAERYVDGNQSRLERQHVDNAEEEEKGVKKGGKGQEKTKDKELLKLAIHKSSKAIRRKHRTFKQGKMEVQMSDLEHLQPVIDPLNKLSESLRDHEVETEKSFDEPVDLDITYGKYGDHTDDEEEEFKDAEIVPEEHIPVNYEDSNIIREIPRKSSLTGDHIRRPIRKKKRKSRTSHTPHLVQESKKTRQDNNSFSGSFIEQRSAIDVDVPLDESVREVLDHPQLWTNFLDMTHPKFRGVNE
ncbi:hypothetical protein QAD02_006983 [Eretmocerus hayati]|uniref:Uncharacterized protein n=1 Tax=Eretmocerus hayati TaxID=131215 RepID=A0ACC2N3M1_9HYME|nr:hypothetical protein QAD02_006983 [Eretmocerus hayati]